MSMHYRVFKKVAITVAVVLVVVFLSYDFLALPAHGLYSWSVSATSAFITLTFLSIGVVVCFYARDRLIALSFFGYCWTSAIVVAGESGSLAGNIPAKTVTGIAVFYAFFSLILLLLLFPHNFFVVDSEPTKWRRRLRRLALCIIAGVPAGVALAMTYLDLRYSPSTPYPGNLQTLVLLYLSLASMAIVIVSILSYYRGNRAERQQLRFFCAGVFLSIGPFFIFVVMPPIIYHWSRSTPADVRMLLSVVTPCAAGCMVLLPVSLGYAILRYQMFIFDSSVLRVVTVIARAAISTVLIFIILFFALLLPPKFALMFSLFGTMVCVPLAWWAGTKISQQLLLRYHTIYEQWPDAFSLESLLHQLTDSLCTLFHARWSDVLLLDEERGIYVRLQAASPASELARLLSERSWTEADSDLVRHLLRTKLLWEGRLDEQQSRRVFTIGHDPTGHHSLQAAPLWHQGKLIGIALLAPGKGHLPSTTSELDLLTDLLARYARLLDSARINTLLSERSRWMRGLLQLTASVSQQNTRDMAQAVVETLLEVIGVGSSVDLWLERNTLLHHTAHAGTQDPPVGTSPLQFVEDASAVYCEETTGPQEKLPPEIAAQPGPFAWIPIRHGERLIGALLVTQGPYRYTPYERKLLDVFAAHCAAAFVRAERAAQYAHVRDDIAAQVRHREVLLDLAQMSLGEVQEAIASPVPRPLPSWPARPPHSQERDPIACVLQEILSVIANTQHLMMQDQQSLPPRLDCAPSGEVWLLCPDEHERAAFELLFTLEGYTPKEMNWHQMIQRLTEPSSAPPVAVVIDEDAMPVAVPFLSQGLAEWGFALSQMPPLLMLSTQAPIGTTGDAFAVVQKPVSLSRIRRFVRGEN